MSTGLGPLSDHRLADAVAGASARGSGIGGVPPRTGALLDRYARTAAVLDGFHHRLLTRGTRTPFPAADLRAALGGVPAARR